MREHEEIKAKYSDYLYQKGMNAPFLWKGKQVNYLVLDVNDKGQLVVLNSQKETLCFDNGELKFLI